MMNEDYSKVHIKMGKMSKPVDAQEIIVGDKKLGDLLAEYETMQALWKEMSETLKDCFVVRENDDIIVALDDKLQKGQLKALKPDKGENVRIMKVENGKIVEDKQKVGSL